MVSDTRSAQSAESSPVDPSTPSTHRPRLVDPVERASGRHSVALMHARRRFRSVGSSPGVIVVSSQPVSQVRELIRRSEYLLAYDAASERLGQDPNNIEIGYLAVLALARSGATDRAEEELNNLRLEDATDIGDRLMEDIGALRARLSKDRALASQGQDAIRWASRAADEYEAAFQRSGGHFTCINAATMALLAGDHERSRTNARSAIDLVRANDTSDPEQQYWREATSAEAALLLGDLDTATAALERAAGMSTDDTSMRATTRKQLSLVCSLLGTDAAILDVLSTPTVIHYTGHMFLPDDALESRMRARIVAALEEDAVGVGYGALAGGADIMVAEALLERGSELNVILPCPVDLFIERSVRPAGESWVERFRRCLKEATSVIEEPTAPGVLDAGMFGYASQLAMGHAVVRAQAMTAGALQLAVWDEVEASGPAGTGADVERWRSTGRSTTIVPARGLMRPHAAAFADDGAARQLRCMLFGDVHGFSSLDERQVQVFVDVVLSSLARAIDGFGDTVLYRNTWGDGLYLVLDSVIAAAECAMSMQTAIAEIDLDAARLPDYLGLRIGGHAGPVFEATDPIRKERNYFGTHVTRTARIEPRTPEGAVYVTRSFAALLALEAPEGVTPEYVGHIPVAKDYGTFPMYVLRPRGGR